MSFSTERINEAKAVIAEKRAKAESEARARLLDAYNKAPELKEIDECFPKIGARIVAAFAEGGEKTAKAVECLRKESEELKAARADCLKAVGLDSDYTAPRYSCKKCEDTGYIEFKMCDCLKRELVKLGYKNSGLGALLERQSFENFSLDYYTGEDKYTMQANLQICKNYANEFGENSPSLFMYGGTGLGKTHLSTAIAARVIEKGFDVQYVTAQNLISDFIFERYHRSFGDNSQVRTDKYFEAELLIIDDFGTEENNQFSVSAFYNLINSRYNQSKATIISTNFPQQILKDRYAERITSRLFGEYTVVSFPGRDVRMQKLMQ